MHNTSEKTKDFGYRDGKQVGIELDLQNNRFNIAEVNALANPISVIEPSTPPKAYNMYRSNTTELLDGVYDMRRYSSIYKGQGVINMVEMARTVSNLIPHPYPNDFTKFSKGYSLTPMLKPAELDKIKRLTQDFKKTSRNTLKVAPENVFQVLADLQKGEDKVVFLNVVHNKIVGDDVLLGCTSLRSQIFICSDVIINEIQYARAEGGLKYEASKSNPALRPVMHKSLEFGTARTYRGVKLSKQPIHHGHQALANPITMHLVESVVPKKAPDQSPEVHQKNLTDFVCTLLSGAKDACHQPMLVTTALGVGSSGYQPKEFATALWRNWDEKELYKCFAGITIAGNQQVQEAFTTLMAQPQYEYKGVEVSGDFGIAPAAFQAIAATTPANQTQRQPTPAT